MPASKFVCKKYMGDDEYSWAVFYRNEVKGIKSPVCNYSIKPIISGLNRTSAQYEKKLLDSKSGINKIDDDNQSILYNLNQMKKRKTLSIYMHVDFMSSAQYDNDPNKEYDDIEAVLKELFVDYKLNFKRNIYPHQLKNDTCNIYLFDFGGLLPGCEDTIKSHFKSFIEQADDHPNTIFLLYSRFTERWYKEVMEFEYSNRTDKQFNVLFWNTLTYDSDDDNLALNEINKLLKVLKC